jgi:hypothetical protein
MHIITGCGALKRNKERRKEKVMKRDKNPVPLGRSAVFASTLRLLVHLLLLFLRYFP